MSDTKTVQIIPANDWFFIHAGDKKPTVHVIAAWALKDDGTTVGLIGGVQTGPGTVCPGNRLVGVPPVLGTYKHLRDLSQAEREALESTS
ncbi:hypothetical protein KW830_04460 [Comamonas sp. CMM03]|uniref:hypothetical protein n=1 Tax=Comamonas sp. CMM03 TaxID=2854781 RepID=UPI001C465F54|nr:hypothetical protein [Comamonas sp. CMM03]MBV7417700.1 hypothetical protein [Comamonas sp. CMM03]